jgi:hypothetical protein
MSRRLSGDRPKALGLQADYRRPNLSVAVDTSAEVVPFRTEASHEHSLFIVHPRVRTGESEY